MLTQSQRQEKLTNDQGRDVLMEEQRLPAKALLKLISNLRFQTLFRISDSRFCLKSQISDFKSECVTRTSGCP